MLTLKDVWNQEDKVGFSCWCGACVKEELKDSTYTETADLPSLQSVIDDDDRGVGDQNI